MSTPGITGWLGKWPLKYGSCGVTCLMPRMDFPVLDIHRAVDQQHRVAVRDELPDAVGVVLGQRIVDRQRVAHAHGDGGLTGPFVPRFCLLRRWMAITWRWNSRMGTAGVPP
ncbi:MAG: hypothetical protein WDN72_06255 [Alphaproteobacteria bacterium]